MDFTRRRRDHKPIAETPVNYPHVFNLYTRPPDHQLTLEEFEEIALERVKVLRILEQTTIMGHKLFSKDWKECAINFCRKESLRRYIKLIESSGTGHNDADESIRRVDHISHFILLLTYCRSQDLRRWFIQRELELFRFRFMNLTSESIKDLIRINKLEYTPISNEEKNEIKDKLIESTSCLTPAAVETTEFFKVHFTEVPSLCSKRAVYVRKGYAYIPMNELVTSIMTSFRLLLTTSLNKAAKRLPILDDDRLKGLLQLLNSAYTASGAYTRKTADSAISLDELDALSHTSYSLCMRSLHETLRSTHHLKHFGRYQYNLFLKGIGLSLDDAIIFWRQELSLVGGEDKFNKEYLYNVKHGYGAIGGGRNYAPQGCIKIISAEPGLGEHHGCPFKTWGLERLTNKLHEYGLNEQGIQEITEMSKAKHYQIACSKYFIHTHKGMEGNAAINHPNEFFDESQKLLTMTPAMRSFKKQKTAEDKVCLDDDFDMSQIDDVVNDLQVQNVSVNC